MTAHKETSPDMQKTAALSSQKAVRLGFFRHFSYGTIAAIGLGAAAIGLGSLGLEVLMARLLNEGYGGTMLGLPFPFISMPMGVCALLLTGLVASKDFKLALYPLLGAVVYWSVAITLWIST